MCATCFETLSRRSFVAGAALAAGGTLTAGAALALAEEVPQTDTNASSDAQAAAVDGAETPLPTYSVSVYDFDGVRIHAFNTQDALGDVCYIVEGADELVGIELPPMQATLLEWQLYIANLGKPMNNIWVDAHPSGGDYLNGVNVWGTQAAEDAIEGGSTNATASGLAQTFGDAWNPNNAAIDNFAQEGPVTVGGIDFEVINSADTYDLVIPAANCVYTHMLGQSVHSIVVSLEAADATIAALQGYQQAGYVLVLPGHTMPEGQQAVADKIAYLRKLEEIAGESSTADEFKTAMLEAFPGYSGENYLEMTAGYLFPEA